MAKPAVAEVPAEELEKVAQELGHNKLYDGFYVKKSSSTFFKECDALNDHDKTYNGVKELCTKLISSLEQLAAMRTKNNDYNDRCNYLPYWLFDELDNIYKKYPPKKAENVLFVNKLIDIGNKVNRQFPGNKCTTLPFSNTISLDARKNRKNSYIYLKKYEEIKQIINAKGKGKCDQYIKYLKYIDSLHKSYKKNNCTGYFFVSRPEYADCNSKYEPSKLISILNECKGTESSRGGSASSGWWFSGLLGSSNGSSPSRKDASAVAHTRSVGKGVDKGEKETPKSPGGARDSSGSVSQVTASAKGDKALAREAPPGNAASLVTKVSLSLTPGKSPGTVVSTVPSYSTNVKADTVAVPIADSSGNLGTVSDKQDSNFYRNIIMATAILGTIFFLFYYNMSSGLKSRFPKRKRKKKIFEHNYYEEYEKELEKYGSEDMSLDSEDDRYYLNYQPERDYD
ncbi:Plasmodium vivax Vir protein, putative [Plasmodium vivax]|uniref:Vir protein, putative n=1 Tax=Plasmodium vivax TaxID=5855 RepID=A0A1G4E9Z8_PLAVI|nr:Plasmodium vivax Vir protein, putative [Plasmodium vivax]